jgi:hypothetical protein
MLSPSDKDQFICEHCGKKNTFRSPYIYAPRQLKDAGIQIIDTWNIPYSTGFYLLSKDEVPKEEVEKFATEKAHFPFWPLRYLGKLWAKETWDD